MENERRVSFKDKLRAELFKGIKGLSWVVTGSYLLVIGMFVILTKYTQLAQEKAMIEQRFVSITQQSDYFMRELGKSTVSHFLDGELSERDLYRKVYENLGKLPFEMSLSIYDSSFERQFSTYGRELQESQEEGFLKMVLSQMEQEPLSRVTRDSRGNRSLLRIAPVLSGTKSKAYIVLKIDSKEIEDYLEGEAISYLIADRFDNYLTSNTRQGLISNTRKVDSDLFRDSFQLRGGNLYLTSSQQIESNIWLYSFILAVPLLPLAVFVVVISGVVFLLLHRTAKHLSRTIALHSSDAVDVLVTDLDLIMDGYQSELAVETDDEFGYLAQKINSMIHTLQSIFRQSLELEKEKTQYQRRMLEAQFNPHFLYNSLESLKILMAIDTQKAERMILAMNRVLRYSVASHQENSCVEDDFEVLEDFLMVNAIRFEGLTYDLNYPETMARLRVPKLFLLPLVENALKYGMKDSSTLTITIVAKEEAGEFLFVVQDSGTGFSDAFLTNIATYLKTGGSQHGLINSYKRLEMMYSSSKLVVEKNRVLLKIEKRQACINSLL